MSKLFVLLFPLFFLFSCAALTRAPTEITIPPEAAAKILESLGQDDALDAASVASTLDSTQGIRFSSFKAYEIEIVREKDLADSSEKYTIRIKADPGPHVTLIHELFRPWTLLIETAGGIASAFLGAPLIRNAAALRPE